MSSLRTITQKVAIISLLIPVDILEEFIFFQILLNKLTVQQCVIDRLHNSANGIVDLIFTYLLHHFQSVQYNGLGVPSANIFVTSCESDLINFSLV